MSTVKSGTEVRQYQVTVRLPDGTERVFEVQGTHDSMAARRTMAQEPNMAGEIIAIDRVS